MAIRATQAYAQASKFYGGNEASVMIDESDVKEITRQNSTGVFVIETKAGKFYVTPFTNVDAQQFNLNN